MSESIGTLYPTKVPSLSDPASIQEAFRIYHYGADSGSGVGEYDINNTDPENLENPSIAYFLHDLQSQITDLSSSASLPVSAFTAKGAMVIGSGSSAYVTLPVGTDGYILTANSGASNGIEWALPSVTTTNSVTLTNKTLSAPVINIAFNQQTGTSYTLTVSDNSKMVELSNSSAISLIVPKNSTAALPVGSQISIAQVSTGQVTITPEDGTVVINSSLGLKLRTQWSGAVLTKRGTNLWMLNGDTTL